MTLLVVLGKSGHISSVEKFETAGLASQKARTYSDSGLVCRVVPAELQEDVEYLMGQLKEKREDGFIKEYGIVPNGTRSKGEGARGIGRMIYPAFGGMLEGVVEEKAVTIAEDQRPPSLTFSSKILKFPTQKISDDDLIIRRT